jgi:hypothetical protein
VPGRPAGPERYIDGGSRDNYPITVAVKVVGARRVIGVNLSLNPLDPAEVTEIGVPEIVGRLLNIFSRDQFDADRNDVDVVAASLVTIDPAIENVSIFDVTAIDWLIQRGYQTTVDCFAKLGLLVADPAGNLERLFAPGHHHIYRAASASPPTSAAPPAPARHREDIVTQWVRRGYLATAGASAVIFLLGGLLALWMRYLGDTAINEVVLFVTGGAIFLLNVVLASLGIGFWVYGLLGRLWTRQFGRLRDVLSRLRR